MLGFVPELSVLVVDDDQRLLQALASELGKRYGVTTAADGEQALAKARHAPPDVVVSDVMMPNVDGHALCRTLRAEPAFRTTSIIIMSGRTGTDAVVAALEFGADDCIAKPFEMRELIARIDAQVRARRMERSLVERETRLAAIGTLASSVVHDVRNGLTALLARADFARTKRGTAAVEKDLTIIEGLAVRLNRNLQDILDFARGDDVVLKRRPVSVADFFQRLQDELASTFAHGSVELAVNLEGETSIAVNCDADRLHRALENLLLNARAASVSSTRRPAKVAVNVQVAPDELHVVVDDSGEGIAPEQLPGLFGAFAAHGTNAGTGLGLATVRNIVRAHGGEVHAQASGPLGGARFHVWIPNVVLPRANS